MRFASFDEVVDRGVVLLQRAEMIAPSVLELRYVLGIVCPREFDSTTISVPTSEALHGAVRLAHRFKHLAGYFKHFILHQSGGDLIEQTRIRQQVLTIRLIQVPVKVLNLIETRQGVN